uniref:Phospho-2-dehydro-3-deoxyheptonate aldolase n=1 Tax=Rhizophora mucronata TaxID=61149 RepID=A0A2P2J8H1_RHIMU
MGAVLMFGGQMPVVRVTYFTSATFFGRKFLMLTIRSRRCMRFVFLLIFHFFFVSYFSLDGIFGFLFLQFIDQLFD